MKPQYFQEYQHYNSFKLIKEPKLEKSIARWVLGIFGILILITFLPWTQNIRSSGRVTTLKPEDRPQTIHSTIGGRIEKWHVAEGEFIEKGDTIISLSEIKDEYFDPLLLARTQEQIEAKKSSLAATIEKSAALQEQIEALKSGLVFSIEKAANKVQQAQLKIQSDSIDLVAARTDYEIAVLQFERQETLYQQGLKSRTEFEAKKLNLQESSAKQLSASNKFFTSKNELLNASIELKSIEAEYKDKIAKAESEYNATLAYVNDLEGEISKQTNYYSNLAIRSTFYAIYAPQDGYLVKALISGIGETIKEGQAVASVMPANPDLAVALYVRPLDLPLLEIGRDVRLQFDGWPALAFAGWPNLSFGTFAGEVAVIDNIDSQGNYRILVVPDEEEGKWPDALRVGSGVYGWAMLNEVPIWYELWRQFNGFPADYVSNADSANPQNQEKKE